jgi:phosphopantothenoylcysteine decarboxylase/phosphopantothenate--cysteine ligase
LATLQQLDFVSIVPPVIGHLACGEFGEGKLVSQERLLNELYRQLHPNQNELNGLKALVTSGGTQVALDDVRVLTNLSSGKMGEALADELWAMGADVTLVHANALPHEKPYACINAATPTELLEACIQQIPHQQLLFMAAAVSDYQPAKRLKGKMKKQDHLALALEKSVDVLEQLGKSKQKQQCFVAFAAESGELNGAVLLDKLKRKNCDAIVYNDISRNDIALGSNDNEVVWFTPQQEQLLPKASKPMIARQLVLKAQQLLQQKSVQKLKVKA